MHGLSGYSGGGRPVIEQWEDPRTGFLTLPYEAPYSLGHVHKHVPEMQLHAGLDQIEVDRPFVSHPGWRNEIERTAP